MKKQLPLLAGTILQHRYKITKLLGAGGMGAVYEAYDERTSAYIALKETFAEDDYEIAIFEREAKLLANLDHEALPRVMDYFAENDGYFLVMELIQGEDLEVLLSQKGKPFEVETVLEWADQILDALDDLHSKGIIHRDIKPANIKVTPRGKIKLIDFGIAKGTAGELTKVQTINAASGSYSPLEQILRVSEDAFQMLCIGYFKKSNEILEQNADERADIYALGATLYQLLTNRLPVNAPTRALAIWSGQGDKLVPAHQINPQIPDTVSSVLWKAMEIDRTQRPATAIELREKLKESIRLNPQPYPKPEVARPTPTKKSFVSRRKLLSISIIGAVVILSLLAMTIFFRTSDKSYKTISGHRGFVDSLAFSPDGKTIVSGGGNTKTSDSKVDSTSDFTVKLWDVEGGNLKQTLTGHDDNVELITFSPDGKTIVSAGDREDTTVKLWDASSGTLKQTLRGHRDSVESVAFSSDGEIIATGSGGTEGYAVNLWSVKSGNLIKTLTGELNDENNYIYSVVFSPDGKTIAVDVSYEGIKLYDVSSGIVKQILKDTDASGHTIVFSPDGKTIAIEDGQTETVRLWDVTSNNLKHSLSGHHNSLNIVVAIAFSTDGKTIASGRNDAIILWDVSSGTLKQKIEGQKLIFSLAFAPDGKTLASGSWYNIKLWRVE